MDYDPQHPTEIPTSIDTLSVVPRDSVVAVFDEYNQRVHGYELQPRSDIAKMVDDFAGEYVNDALFDAAFCADVIDRYNNEMFRQNVKRAMNAYRYDTKDASRIQYFLGVALDFETINDYIDGYLTDLNATLENEDLMRGAFVSPGNGDVAVEWWTSDQLPPNIAALADLVEDVNLESVIVKSVQTLLRLKDGELTGAEKLRVVTALESIYAPLCEITGFDALAATLLDAAAQTRLAMAGKHEIIEQASEYLRSLGERAELEQFASSLPSLLVGESDYEPIIDSPTGHDVFFSEAFSESSLLPNGQLAEILMRIKTLGSLARKIERNNELPVDVVGMTIIVEETTDVSNIFADILQRFEAMPNVRFVSASSRDEPIHVKGSQEFIDEIVAALPSDSEIPVDTVPKKKGFEVAKVTVYWQVQPSQVIPIEIQCMHKLARKEARVGVDSHTLFKLLKYSRSSPENLEFLQSDEAVHCIERIHDRKARLDPSSHKLNGASERRAANLNRTLQRLEAAPQVFGRFFRNRLT